MGRADCSAAELATAAMQVIQPVPDAITELARVLRPGGRGVLLLPATGPITWRRTPATSPTGTPSPSTRPRPASTPSSPPGGEPEVVMFSGGEPSIHPQILEFCAMALDKGVRTVVLNTNGIRLAHDRGFALALPSWA